MYCTDCGLRLDAWGCCPLALPEDVVMGIKTCGIVNRGSTHPDGCLCTICVGRRYVTEQILKQCEVTQ